jgi:hypothetical protein
MNAASRERHPAGVLEIVRTSTDRARLSRQSRAGRAMQLAPGIYAVGATLPPAAVARHHLLAVVAHVWPSAVICDRSALAGGQPVDGYLRARAQVPLRDQRRNCDQTRVHAPKDSGRNRH